jgi:hypothetical protein
MNLTMWQLALRREALLEKRIWCQTMTAADKSHCVAAGRQKRGLAKKMILIFFTNLVASGT